MGFQIDPSFIRWRLHLKSPPDVVYEILSTDNGRSRFWAESAVEIDGKIHFVFPNGWEWQGEIVERTPPHRFVVNYLGNSLTTFEVADDGQGETDLTLTDEGVSAEDRAEVMAGWVSVLLALKAAVDFGVDLRNHDPQQTWEKGYVEN